MSIACDVYTRLLFPRGFGHPLWEPEPTEAGEVLIGDVGYILDGGFYRLFNAALSSDDPVNRRYGVPDGFEAFTIPDTLRHRRKQALEAGPICSKNVTVLNVEGELDASAGNVGVRSNIRFKLTDEQGAILVLEHPADREVLHPCKDLTQYIVRHHASWHEFAQNVFRLDIGADRIVFVTGWVKTARWALAAATHHARDVEISFGGGFGPFSNMSLSASATQEASMLWEHRFGPKAADYATTVRTPKEKEKADEEAAPPSLDQCLFLHYYMVKHRRFLGPKVMKAQAGYEELGDGGSSPGGEPSLVSSAIHEECAAESPPAEVEMVPGVRSDSDEGSKSVEFILDYILDKTNANCAIASDPDLLSFGNEPAGLHGDQFVELEDYEIPENISQLLNEVRPSLSVIDGVGMLSWHDTPVPAPYPSPSRGRDATLVRPLVARRSRSRSALARHRSGSRSSNSPAPLACFSSPAASFSPLQPIEEAVTSNPGLVGTGTHRDNLALPKKRKREGTPPTPTTSKRATEVQDETNVGSPSSGSRPKRLRLGIVTAGDQLSPTSRVGPPLSGESWKHSLGDDDPDEPPPLKKKGMRRPS